MSKPQPYPLEYLSRGEVMDTLMLAKATYNKWAADGLLLALRSKHNYHFIKGYTVDLGSHLSKNKEVATPLPQVEVARRFAQLALPRVIATRQSFNSKIKSLRHVIDDEAFLLPEDAMPVLGIHTFENDVYAHYGVQFFGSQPIIPMDMLTSSSNDRGATWQHVAFMHPADSPERL